ncbi:YifB family Mg chelatase-like AAA ATPase [Sulfurimonas sp. MAG313]|nr:YifB family Mg chelatase-like AAA ATPase [Sulfurimonas sp. MAG313]MDF1881498.1 YifB family Mg chelatase-like AAA ATPase [Sulfurimonas sp. MAG313]
MKKVYSGSFEGIHAKIVSVETSFSKGLPSFSIVGLGNASIQESKERIKSALCANEYTFPPMRVVINLSPSDLKKEGTHFDLCGALLIALQKEKVSFDDFFIFGELGLDGEVKETSSLFALILSLAQSKQMTKAIVPNSALKKLSIIPNVEFYGVRDLQSCIDFFRQEIKPPPSNLTEFNHPYIASKKTKLFYQNYYPLDFKDIKGQEGAKRAALISATGMHNILLEGSPGCGKSMIAKRLVHILPPLTMQEILENAKLNALEGIEPEFKPLRAFRHPHHTSTPASIFGGGSSTSRIGEVGLAHGGILFFDELPHFSKNILEALREPLEDKKIMISRVNTKIEYPTDIMFIAAMNPCPCGNLLHQHKSCRCSDLEVQRYKNRLSEPFLDRIDLSVQMQAVSSDDKPSLSSSQMHKSVFSALKMREGRDQVHLNGKLTDEEVEKFCSINKDLQELMRQASENFGLSFRSVNKALKVARTIADLEESTTIQKTHLLEALSYRRR